jgi:polyisoprenoid-binding protein YceI
VPLNSLILQKGFIMIKFNLRKMSFALAILTIPSLAQAAVPSWKIIPKNSEITFTATQNHAPIKGSFKTFTGEINFDRAQLDKSNVKVVIDIGSLSAADSDIIRTLLTPDWFDATKFPHAVFTANNFVKNGKDKTGEDAYQAKGKLTIRDKTLPVTLSFVFKEYSPKEAQATGSASIKRTEFGVGQGEWSSSAVVEDGVQITFILTAIPASKE